MNDVSLDADDEQIVTDSYDNPGVKCTICGNRSKTHYRLESEPTNGGSCPRCFSGWLHTVDAEITIDTTEDNS